MKAVGGLLLVVCLFLIVGCKKTEEPGPTPPTADTVKIFKGADVSWVTQMESEGIKFYNSDGVEQECMQILKDKGINSIRLRAWVNPVNEWNSTADLVTKAIRAKNLGMKVMINFHYSDTWADPGHQTKPAAWSALDFTALQDALEDYTIHVMDTLLLVGVTPDWVQIGNETNDGMLWPTGRASTNMSNFATLIKTGYDAVKSVSPTTKVIVHVSNGYDQSLFNWLFDGLKDNGASWDIIGMSLYPSYHSTFSASGSFVVDQECLNNMNNVTIRYSTPVMLVEVGMPAEPAADAKIFLDDIIKKTKAVKDKKGLGVFYWEPQCYANWSGYGLGAFDNNGRPSVAMDAFLD